MRGGLGGALVAEGAGLELGEHAQAVDGPLLELLEGDVCGGGDGVEVQAVRVFDIFVGGGSELLLGVVQVCAPLGVYSRGALTDHGCDEVRSLGINCGGLCQVVKIEVEV